MIDTRTILGSTLLFLSACGAQQSGEAEVGSSLHAKTDIAEAEVPTGALDAAREAVPGFIFAEAEAEMRDGTSYIDLEGQRPDGEDVELDLRLDDGAWRVVEIQRDISAGDLPALVASALPPEAPGSSAARIIESLQTDGRIVFEVFHVDSEGDEQKTEILYDGSTAVLLDEEWVH